MGSFIKTHFSIILAFTLPILLIIGVALSVYIPSLFISTNYDFIYTACEYKNSYRSYCNNDLYSVENGRIVEKEVVSEDDTSPKKVVIQEERSYRLFLHDTEKNESREITLEEAKNYELSGLLTSPDGINFSSSYDRNSDIFFLFGSGSSYGHYLTKGNAKKKLNLINDDGSYYYRNSSVFIVWIIK